MYVYVCMRMKYAVYEVRVFGLLACVHVYVCACVCACVRLMRACRFSCRVYVRLWIAVRI